MTQATIDHELAAIPTEYPITLRDYTRHGQEIISHVYPHHEARVLRARRPGPPDGKVQP